MALAEFASRHLSVDERAAIEAAIAAGRITYCPPAPASGLTRIEDQLGAVAFPSHHARPGYVGASVRGGRRIAINAELRRTA